MNETDDLVQRGLRGWTEGDLDASTQAPITSSTSGRWA
jgi:hypothetical protein